jgi:DNA-binding PadR family transcriptional regulator
MPSSFDNTFNEHFRKPTFDDDGDKKLYQLTKEADEVFEERMPPVPTQEEEREYMEWLADDFRSDPWVTYRFRKYTANPKRVPWKNQRRIKR